MALAWRASGLLAGQVTLAASQWAVIVVLARSGTPQAVGSFVVALAITAPLINAVTLNQRAVLASEAAPSHSLGDHLHLRAAMLSLGLVVLAGLAVSDLIGATTVLTVVFVGLARTAWAVSDILYGPFLRHGRTRLIAGSMVVRAAAGFAGAMAGFELTASVVGAAGGLALGWVVPIVVVDVPGTRSLRRRHRREDGSWPPSLSLDARGAGHTRSLLKLTLPLGLVALLVSVHANLPRYLVAHRLDVAELGYFAALASLLVPGTLAASAVSQAALPRLGQLHRGGSPGHTRLVLLLTAAMVGMGGLGLLVATFAERPLLTLLYGAEYAGRTAVLQWLVVAATFSFVGTVLDAALTSTARFRAQAVASLVGAAVLGLVGWWLAGETGLVGIAQAVTIGSAAATAVRAAALARSRPDPRGERDPEAPSAPSAG